MEIEEYKEPGYRELSVEELQSLQSQLRKFLNYEAFAKYVLKYYPKAESFVVNYEHEYNDEGYDDSVRIAVFDGDGSHLDSLFAEEDLPTLHNYSNDDEQPHQLSYLFNINNPPQKPIVFVLES